MRPSVCEHALTDDLKLSAGDVELHLRPRVGGSVALFRYRGMDVFRPMPEGSSNVLEAASFPLVPFSGRIANGCFFWDRVMVRLPSNFPGRPADPHTIHGYGWLKPWMVKEATATHAVLTLVCDRSPWPWAFEVEQRFDLTESGFVQKLTLTNRDETPMPAGLGVHPYFPRTRLTLLSALHISEWTTPTDGIPRRELRWASAVDWWSGAPVETRLVDTAYGHRRGDMVVMWPERDLRLTITPSDDLAQSVIYVPPDETFFCAEPVSHIPNAHNQPQPEALGLRTLGPGETWSVSVGFSAHAS